MTITQVIAELEKIRKQHGNMQVQANDQVGSPKTVEANDIYIFLDKQGIMRTVIDV